MLEKFLKLIGRDFETLIEQRKVFVKTTEFKKKLLEEQKEVERRNYLKVVKKARKFILYCLKLRSRNFLFHKKVITEISVTTEYHPYKLGIRYIDVDGQSKWIYRPSKSKQYFIWKENIIILYDAFKEVFQEMKDLVDGDVKYIPQFSVSTPFYIRPSILRECENGNLEGFPWGRYGTEVNVEIVLKF